LDGATFRGYKPKPPKIPILRLGGAAKKHLSHLPTFYQTFLFKTLNIVVLLSKILLDEYRPLSG
jgi:hypothetical protein